METNYYQISADYVNDIVKLGFKQWKPVDLTDEFDGCWEKITDSAIITIWPMTGNTTIRKALDKRLIAETHTRSLNELKSFLKDNNIVLSSVKITEAYVDDLVKKGFRHCSNLLEEDKLSGWYERWFSEYKVTILCKICETTITKGVHDFLIARTETSSIKELDDFLDKYDIIL